MGLRSELAESGNESVLSLEVAHSMALWRTEVGVLTSPSTIQEDEAFELRPAVPTRGLR